MPRPDAHARFRVLVLNAGHTSTAAFLRAHDEIAVASLYRALNGRHVASDLVGKLARALGVSGVELETIFREAAVEARGAA
jgi:hypothetical protein